jgi:hypothetical protein
VARDATARLYDVDANSITLDIPNGIVTFRAKQGRLIDLDKLHESIWATRLSGKTGMHLNWIDVTVEGEAVRVKGQMRFMVGGTNQYFVLEEDPDAKPKPGERTVFAQMQEAVPGVVRVSGRLKGWSGHFPDFLGSLPKKPRVIYVKGFQTAKP